MITRIKIKDFQCHESLDIRLDPAITTILGPSDTGKSAIIRALRWLSLNTPRGDGFIRRGEKSASVATKVDGQVIGRERGKSENNYSLDAKEYRAMGGDVPPEIVGLLRLGPENFAGQHDSPFWFGISPPELARQLNRIVDLEAIDTTVSRLAARTRTLGVEKGIVEVRIAQAQRALETLNYAILADVELGKIEELESRIQKLGRLRCGLAGIVEAAAKQLKAGKAAAKQLKAGKAAVAAGQEAMAIQRQVVDLWRPLSEIRRLREVFARRRPDIRLLAQLRQEMVDAQVGVAGLRSIVSTIGEQRDDFWRLRRQAKTAKEEFTKECGGVCPICGGPMK